MLFPFVENGDDRALNQELRFEMSSYSELLKDPRWQKLRLEVLEAAQWMCENCQETEKELHVHHLYYVKGKKPWEVNLRQLVALCKDCHQEAEEAREWLLRYFSFAPPRMMISFSRDLGNAMDHPETQWSEISIALSRLLNDPKKITELYLDAVNKSKDEPKAA